MIEVYGPIQQPLARPIGKRLSRLAEDVSYLFTIDGVLYQLTIEAGFIFDGASIPRLCWTLLGLAPHGIMDGPAIPHDGGYEAQGKFTAAEDDGNLIPVTLTGGARAIFEVLDEDEEWQLCDRVLTRSELDELLRELCKHFGVDHGRPHLVWAGVRAGGWWPWMRNDPKRKNEELEKVGE